MRIFDPGEKPFFYLITEGQATVENFPELKAKIIKIVEKAVQANVSFIQIREKQLPARLVFELASEIARLTKQTPTKLLVNDRADVALAADADGVHLTSNSLSAEIIRRNFPKDFIIGVSAHNLEEAEIAKSHAADFITFSPIFHSPNKGVPQGINILREVCARLSDFPVFALGGVNETNFTEILEVGAIGIAAIRFLNDFENLKKISATQMQQQQSKI